jgi:hypothetical protein
MRPSEDRKDNAFMPLNQRVSAFRFDQPWLRLHFDRTERDLSLPKPGKRSILAPEPPAIW